MLDDGSVIPFFSSYDEDRPPQLHVVFLDRTSNAATPLQSGGWSADGDPLRSVRQGVRLNATLKARPDLRAEAVLAPEYSCLTHVYEFEGAPGERGQAGTDGPDVTVRLGVVGSPYYPRLLVGQIEVQDAPPFWMLADASTIPPADWLRVESRGGDGGRGLDGARGAAGADGRRGCPGSPGGAGGAGGAGGRGASGGRGGRVTIVAPQEEPFLAGVVDARTPGGDGGAEAPSGWVPIWAGDHRDPRLYSWIETKELALLSDFKRVVGCWPIQHIYDEVGDAALDAAFTTDGVVYLSGKRKAHVFFAPNVIYILGPGTEGGYILYGYDPKTRRLHEPTNGRSPEKVQYHPEEKLRGCRGELRLDAAETGP